MASTGQRFRIPRIGFTLPLIAAALLALGCGGDAFTLGSSDATASGTGSTTGATTSGGGGATSSSAATGGGSATTSATTGTGGSPGGEDCGNGQDDDADGLIDCLDEDCDDRVCVEAAPPGWMGPIAFYYGDPGAAPTCDPVWKAPIVGGAGSITTPASTCSCSCATPAGGVCALNDVTLYSDTACSMTLFVIGNAGPGVCATVLTSVANVKAASAQKPVLVANPSCPPVANHVIPAPSFEFAAVVCDGAGLGAGCEGTHVCAPKASAGFPLRHCIYTEGDTACPSGPYAFSTTIYKDVYDDRDCGTCACGVPSGTFCAGSTELNTDLVCAVPLVTVPHDGSCVPVTPPFSSQIYDDMGGPIGGNCNPSGAQLTGGTSPAGAITVCCLPDP